MNHSCSLLPGQTSSFAPVYVPRAEVREVYGAARLTDASHSAEINVKMILRGYSGNVILDMYRMIYKYITITGVFTEVQMLKQ